MQEKNEHINQYTAADIQRYIDKKMTPTEMHAIEKASLEDPFLAEALEGYTDTPVASIPADIKELKERFEKKDDPVKIIPLYKKISWAAAAAIFILLGATATWLWLKPSAENSIAQKKEKAEKPAQQEEKSPSVPTIRDSITPVTGQPETNTPHASIPEDSKPPAAKVHPPAPAKQKEVSTSDKEDIKAEVSGDIASVEAKKIPGEEKESFAKNTQQVQELNKFKNREKENNTEQAPAKSSRSASIPAYLFKGKITDDHRKPLPFVNINIPGTGIYAYTDANGNFSMMHGDTQLVVHVKSVGFQPENFTLHSNIASNNINLKTAENSLSDVVIVEYGKKEKKKVTGNTEKVNDDEPDAEPADGWSNYDLYLLNNERLPQQGYNRLMGSVELSFTVNKFGNVSDVNIENSTCPLCEKEAIRLIKEGPKWKLTGGNTAKKIKVTLQF